MYLDTYAQEVLRLIHFTGYSFHSSKCSREVSSFLCDSASFCPLLFLPFDSIPTFFYSVSRAQFALDS